MVEYHVGSKDWTDAQKAELRFWMGKLKDIPRTGSLSQDIRVYANDQMERIMKVHNPPDKSDLIDAICLEVGSGPFPFLVAWPTTKKRIAIDPLFSMYSVFNRFKIGEKNLGVWCYPIKVENFKYWKKDKFKYIIMSNVLDHCDDPRIALMNMLSNLDLDGAIYLDVILREPHLRDEHPHGWPTAEIFEKWLADILNPHFTVEYMRVVKGSAQIPIDKAEPGAKMRFYTKVVWR